MAAQLLRFPSLSDGKGSIGRRGQGGGGSGGGGDRHAVCSYRGCHELALRGSRYCLKHSFQAGMAWDRKRALRRPVMYMPKRGLGGVPPTNWMNVADFLSPKDVAQLAATDHTMRRYLQDNIGKSQTQLGPRLGLAAIRPRILRAARWLAAEIEAHLDWYAPSDFFNLRWRSLGRKADRRLVVLLVDAVAEWYLRAPMVPWNELSRQLAPLSFFTRLTHNEFPRGIRQPTPLMREQWKLLGEVCRILRLNDADVVQRAQGLNYRSGIPFLFLIHMHGEREVPPAVQRILDTTRGCIFLQSNRQTREAMYNLVYRPLHEGDLGRVSLETFERWRTEYRARPDGPWSPTLTTMMANDRAANIRREAEEAAALAGGAADEDEDEDGSGDESEDGSGDSNITVPLGGQLQDEDDDDDSFGEEVV